MDATVRAARAPFNAAAWYGLLPAARQRLLLALADRVDAGTKALARLETLSKGRPLGLSRMLVGAGSQWLRYMIQDPMYDRAVEGLGAAVGAMKVGSGFADGTQIGPMVSARHRDRVAGYMSIGKQDGTRAVTGGAACAGPGYFVQPTVFADVKPDARIAREEIFGPVVATARFHTEAEGIQLANDTPYGLAASICSNDLGRVNRLVPQIKAGTVWVNTHNMVDPNMPFGGYKQSGIGREHERDAIRAFLETESVCIACLNKS